MSNPSYLPHLNAQINYNASYDSFLPAKNPPTEIEIGNVLIGQGIQEKYETGRQYTPDQKCKIAIITTIAIIAILAVAALVVGIMSPIAPLAYAAGAIILCTIVGGALYFSMRKPDLNLPKERAAEVQRLANASFSEIMSQYSLQRIKDYRLLDGVAIVNPNEHTRKTFYFHFEQLAIAYQSLRTRHLSNEREIWHEYHNATAPERNAYAHEVNEVQNRIAVTDSIAAISHIGDRRRRHRTNAFDVVATGNRFVGGMQMYDARNRLESRLEVSRRPRDSALQLANVSYNGTLTKLNALYQSYKTRELRFIPSQYQSVDELGPPSLPKMADVGVLVAPTTPTQQAYIPIEMQPFAFNPPPPYEPSAPSE